MMQRNILTLWLLSLCGLSRAFVFPGRTLNRGAISSVDVVVSLDAAGGKKKKRRRRKTPIPDPTAPSASGGSTKEKNIEGGPADAVNADIMAAQRNFDFSADAAIGLEVADDDATPLDLPNIRDTRERKKEKEVQEAEEQAKEEFKPKINRRDIEAMKKLIEQQPFADADDSFFEEEEYGAVSALLAEKAKPFLGIGAGPLQVGHFIGALGIVLMAFIEYPGFPLTNLPSPLRGALQGGLGTVYAINTVLAVLATFKAGERGQSRLLWAAKTFSVGGLAFDQLSQLPTTEEVEKRKSIKGKRALGKNKL
mmetsp:Transcript_46432/g.140605  ORF Transcript_46432/g.140605 Transcript_46432/m.140605 type:complete len:309 (-) Transcript_46432:1494-2420(-)